MSDNDRYSSMRLSKSVTLAVLHALVTLAVLHVLVTLAVLLVSHNAFRYRGLTPIKLGCTRLPLNLIITAHY